MSSIGKRVPDSGCVSSAVKNVSDSGCVSSVGKRYIASGCVSNVGKRYSETPLFRSPGNSNSRLFRIYLLFLSGCK